MQSLVLGLEHPEGLDISVAGDTATVQKSPVVIRSSSGARPGCGVSRTSIETRRAQRSAAYSPPWQRSAASRSRALPAPSAMRVRSIRACS